MVIMGGPYRPLNPPDPWQHDPPIPAAGPGVESSRPDLARRSLQPATESVPGENRAYVVGSRFSGDPSGCGSVGCLTLAAGCGILWVWSVVGIDPRENGRVAVGAVSETRQGVGFPDWVIVQGSARLFDWYGDTVTELAFIDSDGNDIRLAVCDRTRRVIRSGAVGRAGSIYLGNIPGLVRRFYGPDTYGHTEYFVAGDWS